ncbi:MAG: DNA primase, partial [Acidimicrobiia bacterium]
ASGGRPNCRGIVEVEAESVAYMVCAALGVDSAGYSLPYVASWSGGDMAKVADTADRVIRCARHVINSLEPERDLVLDQVSQHTLTREKRGVAERPLSGPTESMPTEERHRDLEEALSSAVAFYQKHLEGEAGDEARRFLQERGLGDPTASRWQLGYAPAAWDTLVNHLRSHGIPDEVLLEAGLAGRARTGRLYDRMRRRVIFPVFDAGGSPRGFAGRLLSGDGPKYLNSPETPLYKKSALLYGLDHAQEAIDQMGQAIVVEGYTDAIAAHQAGFTNTVATGGTALTPQQIEALRPLASTLTLVFDGDQAGLEAALRVGELPAPATSGLTILVARLPDANDPASLLSAGRPDLFGEALEASIPLAHHQIDQIVAKYALNEPEALARAIYATRSVIAQIENTDNRAQALDHLARRVGRNRDLVELSLQPETRTRGTRFAERTRGRTLT